MSLLRKYRKKVKQPARVVRRFYTNGQTTFPARVAPTDDKFKSIDQDIRPWLMEHAVPMKRISKGCFTASFTPDQELLFKLRWT